MGDRFGGPVDKARVHRDPPGRRRKSACLAPEPMEILPSESFRRPGHC